MPFEKGGRADKAGNRYEINCIIYEMLKVLDEVNYSVVVEALGADEIGTDIVVTTMEGKKEHQQCKARNASKEYWDISGLKAKGIFKAWDVQLNRDNERKVALVSPIACSCLEDLHKRALNTSGKAEDFYNIQIMKSSKEFQKFYQEFCTEMKLNISEENDIIEMDILKSIDYLKRVFYKQISEAEIRECINQAIQFLFRNDKNVVYNTMVSLVCTEDILGKDITQPWLVDYLETQKIEMRLRDGDNRILPRLSEINQEYRYAFKTLRGGLIHRKEFDDCIKAIQSEQSFIISGGAGYGKSGCTEAIIDYCELENIPHIAIKLDQRVPHSNCEAWGRDLGLSGSIVHAIHCISKNEKAVIVLDQLDALRWTQANSSESLLVCMELIRQVQHFNRDRKNKIIVVFVCRAYDLENDNNISSLFEKGDDTSKNNWMVIRVQSFDEDTVKKIIGKRYDQLSPKLKKLLQIPSNIYIWQHLDKGESYNDCLTASHLIEKWYQQICKKSATVGVSEKVVIETEKCIVNTLDRMGRLYAPKQILNVETTGLEYLISCEMIFIQKSRVGFVHQSILDYFMSKQMTEKYYNNQDMEEIIGEKTKQTPNKRYQVQMFLQNLLDYDTEEFITAGETLLVSKDVRYYMKFVFYEILGQIPEPDDNIIRFIVGECENETYGDYLLDNVIFARKQYVSVLNRAGILERWFGDLSKKEVVFRLLQSISPYLDVGDIAFIKEHAFKNKEDDRKFIRCFLNDFTKESDEMFELRMRFYQYYPDFSENLYIDKKTLISQCEIRTIRLIAFWLQNKIQSKGRQLYRYEEDLIISDNSWLISNGEAVLDLLLPSFPMNNSREVIYSGWSGRYQYMCGLERCCVQLVKKANVAIIAKSPEVFWKRYQPYMGRGYHVFNEIILDGMKHLPNNYSNSIISYISSDLDKNIFDNTSGSEDKLGFAKEIIKVHGNGCTQDIFESLEKNIYRYISPKAIEWYRFRIEKNRRKEDEPVYYSFWGDVQWELLNCLPKERLCRETENLLQVLERRFTNNQFWNYKDSSKMGSVKSPICGKRIGKKQWLQIITNIELPKKRHSEWIEEKKCFVESSYSMYVSDFRKEVRQEPETMIRLVIKNKDNVLPAFIDSMFSGVAFSEILNKLPIKLIERMLLEFPCDMESERASYFCIIIENLENVTWSMEVIKQLKRIALSHKNPKSEDTGNSKEIILKSCRKLHEHALNCVRGHAIIAISHLLRENEDMEVLEQFRDTIDSLIKDANPIIRFASLHALWSSYNIDRSWTEDRIMLLYESDIRMAGYHDSRDMLFSLYPKYGKRVLKIIEQCMASADKELVELGSHAVCEFYIRYHEFETVMSDISMKNETQIKAILDMAIVYLGVNDYRELAKSIILKYKNSDIDVGFPLSQIFNNRYIDTEHDKEFLLEFMKSNVSRGIIYAFTHYLEENAVTVVDYAGIIIILCENVLQMESNKLREQWGIEDEISKLIMALYDETANTGKKADMLIADKCLDLWDIMFEKQLGSVREISYELMER